MRKITDGKTLTISDLKAVSEKLAKSAQVRRLDSPTEPQGWTLAYTFQELEEIFRNLIDTEFSKLAKADLSEDEINSTLHAIGESFRHISYHLKDAPYYSYLWPDEHSSKSEGQ